MQRHASCFSLLPLFSLLAVNLHRLCNGGLFLCLFRGARPRSFHLPIAAVSDREYRYCPRGRDQPSSPVRYSVGATLERHLICFTARTSRLCSCVPDRKF